MAKKLQFDWFDVFMPVPIRRRYVRHSESLEALRADKDKIQVLEVVQHGYVIHTRE